jgi:WD40 repeat protein
MNLEACICKFKDCNLIFENAITLPCGDSLCKHHLDNLDGKFVCQFCDEEHELTKSLFVVNKTIIKLIETCLESIPIRAKIGKMFKELVKLVEEYEKLDSDEFIYDYFAEIRNKIDLHREILMIQDNNNNVTQDEINKISEDLIDQLKEIEEKHRTNCSKIEKKHSNELYDDDLCFIRQKLRIPIPNEQDLHDLFVLLNDKLIKIKNELFTHKKAIFMDKSIEFKKFKGVSLFGKLVKRDYSLPLSKDCGKILEKFNHDPDDPNKHVNKVFNSILLDEYSRTLIGASEDGDIKMWDLDKLSVTKELNDHNDSVTSVLTVPNGNILISGSLDETIKIWSLDSFECLHTLKIFLRVHSLCLLSDDQIACGCDFGSFIIWNLVSLNKVRSFRVYETSYIANLFLFDQTKLIVCPKKGMKIQIWDLQAFKCIKQLQSHFNGDFSTELTLNGDLLTYSSSKNVQKKCEKCINEIKLTQITTGDLLKSIEFNHPVSCVKSLNEDLIAVALENGDLQIYDLCDMEMLKCFLSSYMVNYLSLLSNGILLSASTNGYIQFNEMFEQKSNIAVSVEKKSISDRRPQKSNIAVSAEKKSSSDRHPLCKKTTPKQYDIYSHYCSDDDEKPRKKRFKR